MNIKAEHLSKLRRGMRSTVARTPAQQDHVEVRLLTAYMTVFFIWDSISKARFLLGADSNTWMYKIASIGHATSLLGWIFIVGALLALPHAIALITYPESLWIRWPRKAAATGAAIVAIAWAYLTVLAMPIDGPPLVGEFLGNAAQWFVLSLMYAVSLNAQLLREYKKHFTDEEGA